MDQKSWLWKKRSTEKTLVADKANGSSSRNEEVTGELLIEKAELERDLRIVKDKLSTALSECNVKDTIAKKQVKIAQEAIAGWEKAEIEAVTLKQELDKVSQQRAASEERSVQLDAALKQCMQQLRFVRDDQEKRVHGAVVKTSEEYEKLRLLLDEKLAETGKKLARLDAEKTHLVKILSGKEKVIHELNNYRTQLEDDLNSLALRLESTEKENASLKYEVRVLEKEREIRNNEREFDRRTADVAQRQQQESVKKIAKLESECQRLRLLVQKRLPSHSTITKMKNEVQILGKNQVESRRRKSNSSSMRSMDFRMDTSTKRISFLTEQLYMMEEENRTPKHTLNKKSSNELQFSTNQYARTPSRLSGVDGRIEESFSCDDSWASASISELESYKEEKISEMNLMADFVEMERLAVVSVDYPAGSSQEEDSGITGQSGSRSEPLISRQEIQSDVTAASRVSIHKILELFGGIITNVQSQENNKETPAGYTSRVFQWKSDELAAILRKFIATCNDLLKGMCDLEQFVREVCSNLEWVMNHCFSIQDVSSMKDAIRYRLDWDDARSESEVESGLANHFAKKEKGKSLNFEVAYKESLIVDLESGIQLQESDAVIGNLKSEMETMKQSDGITEDQTEKEDAVKEDQNTRFEIELRNESSTSARIEERCDDLQIQLDSEASKKEKVERKHWENQLRNDWEITAASAKLAECQETILNLGKQLKALALPRETPMSDKVVSTTPAADTVIITSPQINIGHRSSLLDKMLADDDDDDQIGGSPQNKENIQNGEKYSTVSNGINEEEEATAIGATAIVPLKKNEGKSFLKKLFWLKKRVSSKKTPFS